jgi:hypothetical protein
MKDVRSSVGESVVRECQSEKSNGCRLSAAASLDSLYFLIATAALYFWFADLHRHGTPSRTVVAALAFSPLVGGIVLGLRGHVLPTVVHVVCGGNCAIAAILPLVVIRPGSGNLLRVSWWSVAQGASLLALIALAAGLGSLAGAELGGLVHGLQKRKAITQRRPVVAGIPIGGINMCAQSWIRLRSFRSALGTPVLTAAIVACGAIIAAIIAKL